MGNLLGDEMPANLTLVDEKTKKRLRLRRIVGKLVLLKSKKAEYFIASYCVSVVVFCASYWFVLSFSHSRIWLFWISLSAHISAKMQSWWSWFPRRIKE